MRYLNALSILVLIVASFLLPPNLQAQTEGETPELVILPDADAGLNADMTRASELYTDLMWAVYCRTNAYNIPKSKITYDILIDGLESDKALARLRENKLLSERDLSFIYTERASLRYSRLQDFTGAEEDIETAISLNPENVTATWILAQIVTIRFDYMERNGNKEVTDVLQEKMFATLKRVVELEPDHDRAYHVLSTMARKLGDIELAITSFKALTRIVSHESQYHKELAELYEMQNRLDEAVQSYERVVTIRPELTPELIGLRNHIGQLYLQTGDYPAAIKTFRYILTSFEDSEDSLSAKTESGSTKVPATYNIDPAEIDAHRGIGLAYQLQNEFEQSEFHITRAITLLEEKVKRTRTSFRVRSRERIRLARDLQNARYALGQIYIQRNAPQKAIETFAKILADDDENVPALSSIGIAYQMQDDVKRAEIHLRRAIELSSKDELPDAYNALGYLYAEQGIKLDEAETLVRRALESAPKSGAYLDSLGLIYFKQGKLDAAIENLEQAIRYLPDTPEILLHLVDAYLEKGLKQKALQTLEQAIQLEPDNAELLQKLEAVKPR